MSEVTTTRDSLDSANKLYLKSQTYGLKSDFASLNYYCIRKPDPCSSLGECDYYEWRVGNFHERHSGCAHKSEPDYYLSYGYKYCCKFTNELYPELSEEGQRWLDEARFLLQKYMEDGLVNKIYTSKFNVKFNKKIANIGYDDIELKNDLFKEFAFATHPDAYIDAGLTNLPIDDLLKILSTPDLKEWLDVETLKQFKAVLPEMVKKWPVNQAKKKIGEVVEEFSIILYNALIEELKRKVRKIVPVPEL